MIRTIEAVIDDTGKVQLTEPIQLDGSRRALVTVLDEQPADVDEATRLAEPGLADWSRPEEDDAWSHLQ